MGKRMIECPAPGSTPLDPDEMEGLVPGHVTNQGELNRAEHANIQDAVTWAIARPHAEILTDTFLRELKECWGMFGNGRGNTEPPSKTWAFQRNKYPLRLKISVKIPRYGFKTSPILGMKSGYGFTTAWFPSTPLPTAMAATPVWPPIY